MEAANTAVWTIGDQMRWQREAQARMRLEAEVRGAARRAGASEEEVAHLVGEAREAFAVSDGVAAPWGKNRESSVERWVERAALPDAGSLEQRREERWRGAGMAAPPSSPALGNPFRKETWNLTEQMRLMKWEPERARELRRKAEG